MSLKGTGAGWNGQHGTIKLQDGEVQVHYSQLIGISKPNRNLFYGEEVVIDRIQDYQGTDQAFDVQVIGLAELEEAGKKLSIAGKEWFGLEDHVVKVAFALKYLAIVRRFESDFISALKLLHAKRRTIVCQTEVYRYRRNAARKIIKFAEKHDSRRQTIASKQKQYITWAPKRLKQELGRISTIISNEGLADDTVTLLEALRDYAEEKKLTSANKDSLNSSIQKINNLLEMERVSFK